MNSLGKVFSDNPERMLDIGLSEAIGIQFSSGWNILCFYQLRKRLYIENSPAILADMKSIVIDEICNSRKLMRLCERDSRLGYHSEAERHKYYPAKLAWRIEQLEHLIDKDFTEYENILKTGRSLPVFTSALKSCNCNGKWNEAESFRWSVAIAEDRMILNIECRKSGWNEKEQIDIALMDEYAISCPWFITLKPNGMINDNRECADIRSVSATGGGWNATITMPPVIGNAGSWPEKMLFCISRNEGSEIFREKPDNWPECKVIPKHRLNLFRFSPENLGCLMIPECR